MKKTIILLAASTMVLSPAPASEAGITPPVIDLTNNWKADESVLSVMKQVEKLDTKAFQEVIDNYRKPDTVWPMDAAIRSLMVAAGVGYLPAQAELVKCMADGWAIPSTPDGSPIESRNCMQLEQFWLQRVCESNNVDILKSLRDFYKTQGDTYRTRNYLAQLTRRLQELAPPEPEPEPEPQPAPEQASNEAAPSVPLFNADGSPTDETVNNLVRSRFSLLVNKDATLADFSAIFAETILELRTSKPVTAALLYKKQQDLSRNWPGRAIKILSVGVSGRKIEVNVAFVYKKADKKKEINGYNKVTLLLDDKGKISGMSEAITAGSAPALSNGFKQVSYTAGEPLFIVAQ